jgi:Cu/Ag efflux pump CusA
MAYSLSKLYANCIVRDLKIFAKKAKKGLSQKLPASRYYVLKTPLSFAVLISKKRNLKIYIFLSVSAIFVHIFIYKNLNDSSSVIYSKSLYR